MFLIICHDIKGLNDFVKRKIWEHGEDKNNPNPSIPTQSYEIPLSKGDLGAALHNIKVDIIANRDTNGKWKAKVKASDKFDFTEFKNPLQQNSILEGALWAANDIAYYDQKWGLLDPVKVEITYTKAY